MWCDPTAGLLDRHRASVGPNADEGDGDPAPVDGDGRRRDVIPWKYHDLARRRPDRIRSVTVAGETMAGKGVFLLVQAAMLALRTQRLASSFGVEVESCVPQNPHADLNVNLQRQVDDLLVAGHLPVRTPVHARALRSPWIFSRRRRWGRFGRGEDRFAVIFNDIAGEVVTDPHRMNTNEHFQPHLACTTDVVFLLPARELAAGARRLDAFATGLAAAVHVESERRRRGVDLTRVNLILVINQIDRLRHSPDALHAELLEICLREPHALPDRAGAEWSAADYLAAMTHVHHDLTDYLSRTEPGLLRKARDFASVRVCGLSATGGAVVDTGETPNVERCLAFSPSPVRVLDPLLWILRGVRLLP